MKNVKVTTVLVIESTWTEEDFIKFAEDGTSTPNPEEFVEYVQKLRTLTHDELTEVVSDCWDGLSITEYAKMTVHQVEVGEE